MCTILFGWSYYVSTIVNRVINKKQCLHWHPQTRTNYSSATPSPPPPLPPPALVKYIVGSNHLPLELVISFGGLHGAHRCIAASLSSLVNVDATCINSNITSHKYVFPSFNNIDPRRMMLVDCCMLCCRGCGPIVAPYDGGGCHGPSSLIVFYLAFYLGHKPQVRQTQVWP